MELDYSALTTEEMETLVEELNKQIEMKRTSLVDGMLREMYPYVSRNSRLMEGVKNLPDGIRCKYVDTMVDDTEVLFSDYAISHYTEDLTLEDILVLLRIAIESFHDNV